MEMEINHEIVSFEIDSLINEANSSNHGLEDLLRFDTISGHINDDDSTRNCENFDELNRILDDSRNMENDTHNEINENNVNAEEEEIHVVNELLPFENENEDTLSYKSENITSVSEHEIETLDCDNEEQHQLLNKIYYNPEFSAVKGI